MRYRRMALDYDDDLKAAAKRIEACTELERAARAGRIPTLSVGGDFRYTGNPLARIRTVNVLPGRSVCPSQKRG